MGSSEIGFDQVLAPYAGICDQIVHGAKVVIFMVTSTTMLEALTSDGFNYTDYPLLYKSLHEMRWYGLLSIAIYIVASTSLKRPRSIIQSETKKPLEEHHGYAKHVYQDL